MPEIIAIIVHQHMHYTQITIVIIVAKHSLIITTTSKTAKMCECVYANEPIDERANFNSEPQRERRTKGEKENNSHSRNAQSVSIIINWCYTFLLCKNPPKKKRENAIVRKLQKKCRKYAERRSFLFIIIKCQQRENEKSRTEQSWQAKTTCKTQVMSRHRRRRRRRHLCKANETQASACIAPKTTNENSKDRKKRKSFRHFIVTIVRLSISSILYKNKTMLTHKSEKVIL